MRHVISPADGRKFTPEMNREFAKRPQPGKRRGIIELTVFQRALLKVVDCLVEEEGQEGPILRGAKPAEIAACATAWDRLEARRMILAGQGAPKPVPALNDPARQEPTKVRQIDVSTEDGPA